VAVAGGEVAAGTAVAVGGEAVALGSRVAGVATSATTLTVGTAASVVIGVGLGVYELSKAVVVPVTFEVTSGVVLGYSSVSQLAAHSILAVSDVSYMVLSMEGPNWVLYGVKGLLGKGEELVPGTVLDLDAMQQQGEEFKRLPVSTAEMDGVIEQMPQDLNPVAM